MILPSSTIEQARKVREYLPEFARPQLDRLIARAQFDAAGDVLDTIRRCRATAATLDAAEAATVAAAAACFLCPVCERTQPNDHRCSAQDRSAVQLGAAYLQRPPAPAPANGAA